MRGIKKLAVRKKALVLLWALLAVPAVLLTETIDSSDARQANPLSVGQLTSVSHRATDRHAYSIEVTGGGTYLINVVQQDLDLVVTVYPPDGERTSYNAPLLRDERESVLIEPAASGAYRIVLHSDEHTGTTGGHGIVVIRLEDADQAEVDAWRWMTQAAAANFEGGEENWRQAVAAYEQAAHRWRELGKDRELAQTLYSIAALHSYQLAEWDHAADVAASASALYATIEQPALAANADHLRAAALIEVAHTARSESGTSDARTHFDEARRLLEQARATHTAMDNRYELALVINNIGLLHYYLGAFDDASTAWQDAIGLFRDLEEWEAELVPLSNAAVIDAEQGSLATARERLERVAELWPDGKRPAYLANALHNLAVVSRLLGDLDEALRIHSTALTLHRQEDNATGEGRSLLGIGQAYHGMGRHDLATDYLQQALTVVQQVNDGRGHHAVVRTLGNVAFLQGDYQAALDHHRAAEDLATSPLDLAHLHVLQARNLTLLGRHDEATALADQARESATTLGARQLEADAWRELGRARAGRGEAEAAARDLQQALSIYRALGLQSGEADALHALALTAKARGDLRTAVRHGEAALERSESLRGQIADPELRAFHAALRRNYYHTQIDLLMALHDASDDGGRYLHEAFAVSERARSRLLLDMLTEAAVDVYRGADPESDARRRVLHESLADLRAQRDRILQRPEAHTAGDPLDDILANLAAIENELNLIETRLRRTLPERTGAIATETLSAAEIQALMGPDDTLLQYALGSERSHVWVLTHDSLHAIELPPREVIDSVAREAFAYLSRPDQGRPAAAPPEQLQRLSDLVLAPIQSQVTGRRMIVAPDGALQYIPFGALPVQSGASAWLQRQEIVQVPSMSALVMRRHETDSAPSRVLAAFGDPVLQAGDPRFAGSSPSATRSDDEPNGSPPGLPLARLPYTGHEVQAIAELVAEDARLVATGFAANRDALINTDLSDYRYVHFATHGLVDTRYPALSALALSQYDEQSRPRSGFLRLHDIYDLRMRADLVVLSACDTALGREIHGEALVGLTQGFMYAGARNVVASLWQVPDAATAQLMTRFYTRMLTDGLAPSEALRQAQMSLASEPRWRHPYYWASFVLMGDGL